MTNTADLSSTIPNENSEVEAVGERKCYLMSQLTSSTPLVQVDVTEQHLKFQDYANKTIYFQKTNHQILKASTLTHVFQQAQVYKEVDKKEKNIVVMPVEDLVKYLQLS